MTAIIELGAFLGEKFDLLFTIDLLAVFQVI
jgi:hypothetical protein